MKYTVVTGKDSSELSNSVSKLIDDGWILQGGLGVDGGYLAQALIKPSTMGDWERPEFKRQTIYVNHPPQQIPAPNP